MVNFNVTHRKRKGAAALMLALSLLTTSSLAWRDMSQYKTNKFATSSVENNVVLVEDFQEVKNWRVGQDVKKRVLVRNGQDSDDPTQFHYEKAFVRLQFREFMEIGTKDYVYNKDRLMIDEKGDFIRFKSEALGQQYMESHKIPNADRIQQVKGFYDGSDAPAGGYFYIATQEKDHNGQYGKFLVIDVTTSDAKPLVEGVDKGKPGAYHHVTQNNHTDEKKWPVHQWSGNRDDGYAKPSPFTNHVKWNLSDDVISIDKWNGEPVSKWIVDTKSEQGWVYWGQPLEHGQKAIAKKTITSELLESVALVKQPDGIAQYFIHVKMDAVSINDLNNWDDAPSSLLNVFGNPQSSLRPELKALIDKAKDIKLIDVAAASVKELREALENGIAVYESGTTSSSVLNKAIDRLKNAMQMYLASYEQNKTDLKRDVEEGSKIDVSTKTKQSAAFFQKALDQARQVLAKSDNTIEAMSEAIKNLSYAKGRLNELVGLEAYPTNVSYVKNHYYVDFAGMKWEVIGKTTKHAILSAEPLSSKLIKQMGFGSLLSDIHSNSFGEYNLLNFGDQTDLPYDRSNIKNIIESFYKVTLHGKPEEDMVVPVYFERVNPAFKEMVYGGATTIDPDGYGSKQAFLPSYGDILTSTSQVNTFKYQDDTPIWGGGPHWTRTSNVQGGTAYALSNSAYSLSGYIKQSFKQVRPAIVVKNISLPFADSTLN